MSSLLNDRMDPTISDVRHVPPIHSRVNFRAELTLATSG